ncbi:hypothetical protein Lalb_Chr12g0207341 [Lupinus albus]|uniref:Uncharacterized protein n=1 Tax=Lupinus albus TaxID=3870 RepID=A0A6A4PNP4_LUPAL|nr:hypothetical protein Lalb_Chr12g0207341 [Lupinus albus]
MRIFVPFERVFKICCTLLLHSGTLLVSGRGFLPLTLRGFPR